MIAQLCGNSHKNWDKYLPEITFALNTAVRETTGQSAAQVIFGRNPVPPNQIRNEGPTPEEQQTPVNMPKLWEQVKKAAHQASQTQQKYFNKTRRQWQPQIGEQVYKKEHPLSSASRNFAQKLAPKYSGPYQVSKYNTTNIVEVVDPNTNTIHRCHLKDLKTCHLILDMEHKRTTPIPPGRLRTHLAKQITGIPQKPTAYKRPAEATTKPRPLSAPVLAEQRKIAIQDNIKRARETMQQRSASTKGTWRRMSKVERQTLYSVQEVDVLTTQLLPTIVTDVPESENSQVAATSFTTTATTGLATTTTSFTTTAITPLATIATATLTSPTPLKTQIPRSRDPFSGITIRKNKRGRKWVIKRPGRDIKVNIISDVHTELRYANLVRVIRMT